MPADHCSAEPLEPPLPDICVPANHTQMIRFSSAEMEETGLHDWGVGFARHTCVNLHETICVVQ